MDRTSTMFQLSFTVVVLLATCWWPSVAHACSCFRTTLPCEGYWEASSVFTGRVTLIEPNQDEDTRRLGTLRVHFEVTEAFRGSTASTVIVLNQAGEVACGYPFVVGGEYVVYAHRSPSGALSTSFCTRTTSVEKGAAEIAYARASRAIAPGTPAQLTGQLQVWEIARPAPSGVRVKGKVIAKGTQGTFETTIDPSGGFLLRGLPPGEYFVTPVLEEGFEGIERRVVVNAPQGCGIETLYAEYGSRVRGRVVTSFGTPVPGLPLQLVLSTAVDEPGGNANRVQGWTHVDGSFELRHAPPGTYLLALNSSSLTGPPWSFPRAFYPGVQAAAAAESIPVAANAERDLKEFVLPAEVRLVTVRGIVQDEEGLPVSKARIEVGGFFGDQFTEQDGTFVSTLAEGVEYAVVAESYPKGPWSTEGGKRGITRFKLTANSPTIVVRITPIPK